MKTKTLTIAAISLGLLVAIVAIVYFFRAGRSEASSVQAQVSFTPDKIAVIPGEEFDLNMHITTPASASDAGFSAAAIVLRYDLENKGIVETPGSASQFFQILNSNMTSTVKSVEQGTDTKGKYTKFVVAIPLDKNEPLQKTATLKMRFKSLNDGVTNITLDTEKSEIVGVTGEASPLFSWGGSNSVEVVSGTQQPTPAGQKFTMTAQANPPAVQPGQDVSISATFTATQEMSALLDIEVYDKDDNKIYQDYRQLQDLQPNQPRTISTTWKPTTNSLGTYTVKLGVFQNDWTFLDWNNEAATILVTTGITPQPDPEVTITQGPSVTPTEVPNTPKPTTIDPKPTTIGLTQIVEPDPKNTVSPTPSPANTLSMTPKPTAADPKPTSVGLTQIVEPDKLTPTRTPTPLLSPTPVRPTTRVSKRIVSVVTVAAAGRRAGGQFAQMAFYLNNQNILLRGYKINPFVSGSPTSRASIKYFYESTVPITADMIQIHFINDGSVRNKDRDLWIDYIEITDKTTNTTTRYQTEDSRVITRYNQENGSCKSGNRNSEWLFCNGHFQFSQ